MQLWLSWNLLLNQGGLELRDLPASVCWVLELKVCTTTAILYIYPFKMISVLIWKGNSKSQKTDHFFVWYILLQSN